MPIEGYVCDDCGRPQEGTPYWTHEDYGVQVDVLCYPCAGEFVCPDFAEDATPEHLRVCVGECNTAH